ncbi:MAG: fluoride efflux transporter CrcB [Croceitalea sp.]|nr:fluoride efflux transporter CrcB [Croceitalea sp.]NNC33682.1 fluoride efflux transporter CrcB [Croceitalea sp.]NNL08625.1 fluoride efflux transporter CrcB [Croceitalea sp.]
MKQALLVFIGGGFGSTLRYLISKNLNPLFQNFFLGTFTVNIVGCLLMGLLLGLSARERILSENQLLLLATGFCGGFTTFSSFALEKHAFLKADQYLNFSFYLFSSIAMGIAAITIGIWLSKQF